MPQDGVLIFKNASSTNNFENLEVIIRVESGGGEAEPVYIIPTVDAKILSTIARL